MRIRDTRVHCVFGDNANPTILRESCWREATFQSLSAVSLCSLLLHMLYIDHLSLGMIILFLILFQKCKYSFSLNYEYQSEL